MIIGMILKRYLPTGSRLNLEQTTMWNATRHLGHVLQLNRLKGVNPASWRKSAEYYKELDECSLRPPGCVDFSPAWFQQGHTVSLNCKSVSLLINLHITQTADWPLETLATLKPTNPDSSGRLWAKDMYESSALISAMLRVMHPALYSAGRQTMQCLASDDSLRSAISRWSSVFNACTLLSNRWTPNHRDNYSRAQWYDILTTFGAYRGAFLNLSSIRLKLQYSSGTVVGFSGKILWHGVPECEGE